MSVLKRLKKELKNYNEKPIPYTGVEPCDDNFHLWNCVIEIKDEENSQSCPLHFLVEFPPEYPQKAPSVGFSTEFPYGDGASYVINDTENALHGKYVICMDLLGNFAGVHTEWSRVKGSGWSPAYDISSLLIILQAVTTENILNSSNAARLSAFAKSNEYAQNNEIPQVNLPLEPSSGPSSSSDEKKGEDEKLQSLDCTTVFPPQVQSLCAELAVKLTNTEHRESFDNLIRMFAEFAQFNDQKKVMKAEEMEVFDPEIKCWYTQATYQEDTLGYGVQAQRKGDHWSLSTDCNLISRGAYDEGLRVQPNKEQFQFFLPSWINSNHAQKNTNWVKILRKSIKEIGQHLGLSGEKESVMFIFPEILNRMIVLMMDVTSDYRASENIFQCILNIWRTALYVIEKLPGLKENIVTILNDFIDKEDCRRKSITPNIGHTLIMATFFKSEQVNWSSFLDAYDDESILRRVLWLQKDGVVICESNTFENAEISRKNILFQTMFKKVVITTDDMEPVLIGIDQSNCKLPERLGVFLDEWRAAMQKIALHPTWITHFQLMQKQGLSESRVEIVLKDIDGHYKRAIEKANQLDGYHYINRKKYEFGYNGGNRNGGGGNRNGGGRNRGDRNGHGRGVDMKHIPCEDFLNGYCRYGERCRKNHFDA